MTTKRMIVVSLLISILIVGISFGCFLKPRKVNQWQIVYDYSACITTSDGTKFFVWLPVPVTSQGHVSNLVNRTTVTGKNVALEITDCAYGPVFNLTGENMTKLRATMVFTTSQEPQIDVKARHPNGYIDLNLWTGADENPSDSLLGDVWIYLSHGSDNGTAWLWLDLTIGDIHHHTNDFRGRELSNGWNRVAIYAQATVP